MRQFKQIMLFFLAVTFGLMAGCATLDKIAPTYGPIPATTKGPTTKPAQPRDVAGEVGSAASQVAPVIAAIPVPYADLIAGIVGLLGTTVLSVDQMIRKNKHKATAADLQAQLDEANAEAAAVPAGTLNDPLHAVIVTPPKAA